MVAADSISAVVDIDFVKVDLGIDTECYAHF